MQYGATILVWFIARAQVRWSNCHMAVTTHLNPTQARQALAQRNWSSYGLLVRHFCVDHLSPVAETQRCVKLAKAASAATFGRSLICHAHQSFKHRPPTDAGCRHIQLFREKLDKNRTSACEKPRQPLIRASRSTLRSQKPCVGAHM